MVEEQLTTGVAVALALGLVEICKALISRLRSDREPTMGKLLEEIRLGREGHRLHEAQTDETMRMVRGLKDSMNDLISELRQERLQANHTMATGFKDVVSAIRDATKRNPGDSLT